MVLVTTMKIINYFVVYENNQFKFSNKKKSLETLKIKTR